MRAEGARRGRGRGKEAGRRSRHLRDAERLVAVELREVAEAHVAQRATADRPPVLAYSSEPPSNTQLVARRRPALAAYIVCLAEGF